MKICFITKYPPIQGGVSTQCYWAACGLASRGHQVYVITNADEVEDTFRLSIPVEDLRDGGRYSPAFPATGGYVSVNSTKPPDRKEVYYVPMGNPVVSRLASMAGDTIRREACDVIFSYYLEPYGVVANMVSQWTSKPYVFKHAGSDLYRLMEIADLSTTYREVFRGANRILTGGLSRRTLQGHGVADDQLVSGVGFGLPREVFNPVGKALDLSALLARAQARATSKTTAMQLVAPLEPSFPVVGVYGKVGEYKGTFDLLWAAGRLLKEGMEFHLFILGRGWQEGRIAEIVAELGIGRYVRVHPFIPQWAIPDFIRACDAVAFLERDFPIAAHTPTIPAEILSCGRCLIVSAEVLRKQLFRVEVRNTQNVVVVDDPRDHVSLAAALRFALEDRTRAREIGARGAALVRDVPDFQSYVSNLEGVLLDVAAEGPVSHPRQPQRAAGTGQDLTDPIGILARLFPYTLALIKKTDRARLKEHFKGTGLGEGITDRREFALLVGQHLRHALERMKASELTSEVCLYETLTHESMSPLSDSEETQQPSGNLSALLEAPVDCLVELRGEINIAHFDHDIEKVLEHIDERGGLFDLDEDQCLAESKDIAILFHSKSLPLRVNNATAVVLDAIRTTAAFPELVNTIATRLAVSEASGVEQRLASLLEGLYWEGIVSFRRATEPQAQHAASGECTHEPARRA